MNTYAPIFRGVDARGGRKLYTNRHTHTLDSHSDDNKDYSKRCSSIGTGIYSTTYSIINPRRACERGQPVDGQTDSELCGGMVRDGVMARGGVMVRGGVTEDDFVERGCGVEDVNTRRTCGIGNVEGRDGGG